MPIAPWSNPLRTLHGAGVLLLLVATAMPAVETISLSASSSSVEVNDTLTVTVSIADAGPFANWGSELVFDGTKLQLMSQTTGHFPTFVPDSNGQGAITSLGKVRSGGFALSDNSGGSGALAVYTFKGLATGTTSISMTPKSGTQPFGLVLVKHDATERIPTIAGTLSLTVTDPDPVGATPAITSALTASGTTGTAFSYTIVASHTPTSYLATGLPAGLSINTSTGVISGTPTATGTTSVPISATNATGTGMGTLMITITAPTTPGSTPTSSGSKKKGGGCGMGTGLGLVLLAALACRRRLHRP